MAKGGGGRQGGMEGEKEGGCGRRWAGRAPRRRGLPLEAAAVVSTSP